MKVEINLPLSQSEANVLADILTEITENRSESSLSPGALPTRALDILPVRNRLDRAIGRIRA